MVVDKHTGVNAMHSFPAICLVPDRVCSSTVNFHQFDPRWIRLQINVDSVCYITVRAACVDGSGMDNQRYIPHTKTCDKCAPAQRVRRQSELNLIHLGRQGLGPVRQVQKAWAKPAHIVLCSASWIWRGKRSRASSATVQ